MIRRPFNETINGVSLTQIHEAAFRKIVRAYNSNGSVYVSRDDLDEIAWNATMTVYEKKDDYVKKEKNVAVLTGKEITVKYDKPAPLQIDGEVYSNISEYTVVCD